jgi:hypothetical protein
MPSLKGWDAAAPDRDLFCQPFRLKKPYLVTVPRALPWAENSQSYGLTTQLHCDGGAATCVVLRQPAEA